MVRTVFPALPARTAPVARRLVMAALIAAALGALAPADATAQARFPVRRNTDPSLFSVAVFSGATFSPVQWMSGGSLRVRVSRIRIEPAFGYGRGNDFDSMVGWATVSLMLGEMPGLDSYVGAGAAYYRERSDAAGFQQTRAIWAPTFLVGIETDALGIGLFAEGRLMNAEYAGDSRIGATDVGVPSLVAGLFLPF